MTSPYERAHRRLLRYEVLEWVLMVIAVLTPVCGGMYVDDADREMLNYIAFAAAGYLARAVFMWARDKMIDRWS